MSLTSLYYLIYLTAIVALYYTLQHKYRIYLLLAASFVFYYVNQSWYVVFLASAIVINYVICALWLRFRKTWLIYAAITYNVLILAFFKYIPILLFGQNIPDDSLWSRLLLPIGISFFSFQAIGYVLDLYWQNSNRQASFSRFSLYMSFFPQLLAGPIARSKLFLPQIDKVKRFEYNNLVGGATLILWGLFKKLVVANNLAPYTDAVFNNVHMHHGLTLTVAAIAYTIQIYADFSGYSEIAIGSAKMFGFNLIENFRIPFFAKSVTDFWRRWHISLSSWVRDYVNTPLQYKLRGIGRVGILLAALVTFQIIGIWHGANWNFVVFGLLQAAAILWELSTTNLRSRVRKYFPGILGNAISNILVMGFFVFCFILFRARNINDVVYIVSHLGLSPSGFYWGSKQLLIYSLIGTGMIWLLEVIKGDELLPSFIASKRLMIRWSFYIVCTLLIVLIGSLNSENFIYFQF